MNPAVGHTPEAAIPIDQEASSAISLWTASRTWEIEGVEVRCNSCFLKNEMKVWVITNSMILESNRLFSPWSQHRVPGSHMSWLRIQMKKQMLGACNALAQQQWAICSARHHECILNLQICYSKTRQKIHLLGTFGPHRHVYSIQSTCPICPSLPR